MIPQLSNSLDDLATPGVIVEVTAEVAEAEGLVFDDAVDFDTAMDANADIDQE